MTSPPPLTSDHGTSLHHLVTPTVRIAAAAVILITGLGVAGIFWKMPKNAEQHDLYHTEIVGNDLAAVSLPGELSSLIAPGELSLPASDISPAMDDGQERYTHVYQLPEPLAALEAEQKKMDEPAVEEEESPPPAVPQKFAPMRQSTVELPIDINAVNREFQSKPVSVSTAEKSDELHSAFHFAANSRMDFEDSAEPAPPMDPFPIAAASTASSLKPLTPVRLSGLSPLLPLQDSELQSLPVQIAQ